MTMRECSDVMSKMRYGTFRFQGFRARQESIRAAAAADRATMRKGLSPMSGGRGFPWVASSANGLPVNSVLGLRRVRWRPPLALQGRLCSDAFLVHQRVEVDVVASEQAYIDGVKQLYLMEGHLLVVKRFLSSRPFLVRLFTSSGFRSREIGGNPGPGPRLVRPLPLKEERGVEVSGAGKTRFLLAIVRRRLWAEQRGQARDAVAFSSLRGPSAPVVRRRNGEDDGAF
jgi:hypothetical protein